MTAKVRDSKAARDNESRWAPNKFCRTSTLLAEQSAQSANKINRPQMRVALQHPQFFVPADGAHLGNIEPALE